MLTVARAAAARAAPAAAPAAGAPARAASRSGAGPRRRRTGSGWRRRPGRAAGGTAAAAAESPFRRVLAYGSFIGRTLGDGRGRSPRAFEEKAKKLSRKSYCIVCVSRGGV